MKKKSSGRDPAANAAAAGQAVKSEKKQGCCRIESLISVDERGQMVLPKDLRDRAKIAPGDKLALISWEKDGAVCCLTLIKAEQLSSGVRDFIGPMLKDIAT
ncbi:MAG: HgcAB-associated protein [Syntrophaceae bacterium]